MATQPTNLPVPSESYRDLKFNAGKIDEFVTSLTLQYIDRFGNAHYTIEGLRWLAQQAIAQYGWIPVGTFQDGATLTLPNQILKDTTDGSYYRWDGDLPKTVPSGSTPSTSGGTGVGAWLSVGDSTLRAMLAAPGGDKLIGSSWGGGSVWEDYPYKGSVKPSKVIYPSMNTTQIQSILSSAGQIYVSSGTYTTSTAWAIYPNTEIWWDPGATLYPANNNMTVMTCDPTISGGNGVRNVKLHNVRIDISGKTGCKGFVGIKFRNHGHLDMMWVNMGTAANSVGIEIGTLCYGLKVDGCEVIGGGSGAIRLLLRNGANAITVTGFDGYSGTPEIDMPQYGIIVRHGLNGETTWDYVNTFPTEAVVFVGGFSQNCSQYGFLDQAQGTKVYGMFFENNSSSDVRMSSSVGALFHRCTHSSPTAGLPANAYSASNGTLNALIDEPVYGSRAGGFFKIDGGSDGTVTGIVVNINTWKSDQGITEADLGVLSAAKVNRHGVLQLPAGTLNLNMGFRWYRRNVTSGENIAFTGTPYDGQEVNILLRGSNIASLSVAGVPVNVTGANTSTIKMTIVKLVYSKVVGAWVISTGEWNATA